MPEKPKIQIGQKPDWYVMGADGVTYGPFEVSQITDYIKQGRITSDTRIQHPKYTNNIWQSASSVPLLFQFFRTESPPQQQIDLSQIKSKIASKTDSAGNFTDILDFSFKRFATPLVVKILWILFLVSWGLETVLLLPLWASAFVATIGNSLFDQSGEFAQLVFTYAIAIVSYLIYKILSLLICRLICEGLIILFDIRNQLILLRESRQ